MPDRLLFVCRGNTCRSPVAEALAAARDVPAESAGVAAQRSDGAAPFAARALRAARGLSLDDHTPQSVGTLDLSPFDHIVALDASVAQRLRTGHEVGSDRLVTWSIADPYGGSLADYRLCVEQIDTALTRLLSE
jgi:protein-tyrosine phosphatase